MRFGVRFGEPSESAARSCGGPKASRVKLWDVHKCNTNRQATRHPSARPTLGAYFPAVPIHLICPHEGMAREPFYLGVVDVGRGLQHPPLAPPPQLLRD